MTLTIRDYRPADLEACRALCAELVQHHRDIYEDQTIGGNDPGRSFDDYLKNPQRHGTWVAEKSGGIIGMAGLLVLSNKDGEIDPVVVTVPERSRGTGEALVRHAVDAARKAGVRFLSIKPVARNSRAISLYVRLSSCSVPLTSQWIWRRRHRGSGGAASASTTPNSATDDRRPTASGSMSIQMCHDCGQWVVLSLAVCPTLLDRGSPRFNASGFGVESIGYSG